MENTTIRLGVNIDHVATLRNARGEGFPDPVKAALLARDAGADGITAHLREDRRHILDKDLLRLKRDVRLPLNMEMAATKEMLEIARKLKPNACCLVPEKRREVTTEGGLNVVKQLRLLQRYIPQLRERKIRVSLFVDPVKAQIEAAKRAGADIVELHTGRYCRANAAGRKREMVKLQRAAELAEKLGLECHAGHGLSFETVKPIAAIPQIAELNIGHFLIGASVFMGLEKAVREMKRLMQEARA
jgi:pyridoxine 5-phosphate synthase